MTTRRRASEDGSIILGVSIALVIAISLVMVVATVQSSLNLTRADQDRTNAFQFANAGVDRALWRIDGAVMTGSTPYIVGGQTVGFTETLVQGRSRYEVIAERFPPDQDRVWRVSSTGTDRTNGRVRKAIATVAATPLFRDGFLTLSNFALTGSQDYPRAYDSRGIVVADRDGTDRCWDPRPASSPPAGCVYGTQIPGYLGSNGIIELDARSVRDLKARFLGFNMYGRGTQETADADCADGDCAPQAFPIAEAYEVELPDPEGFSVDSGGLSCPTDFNNIVLQPGKYLCDDVQLRGTVTVAEDADPATPANVQIFVKESFGADPGTIANRARPPERLQIYQAERDDGTPWSGTVCGSGASRPVELWALLYTPGLGVDCGGENQPKIFGAVVAQFFDGTGAHFEFTWDVASNTRVHNGRYFVEDWRECPADKDDC